jgi:hypothetical protein
MMLDTAYPFKVGRIVDLRDDQGVGQHRRLENRLEVIHCQFCARGVDANSNISTSESIFLEYLDNRFPRIILAW